MDLSNANTDEEDQFFDALDEFLFHECSFTEHPNHSISDSTISVVGNPTSYKATTLRRCSLSLAEDSDISSSDFFKERHSLSSDSEASKGKNENVELTRDFFRSAAVRSSVREEAYEESTITTVFSDHVGGSVDSAAALGDGSMNLLEAVAAFLIKAIGFQFNLFIGFVSFPLWILYQSYMLYADPFGVKRCLDYLLVKLFGIRVLLFRKVHPYVYGLLHGKELVLKLASRSGWRLFKAVYVCIVLSGLFVSSFVFGGFVMRFLVEEPYQMKELLNFDYSRNSPVAYVPILSCAGVGNEATCKEKGKFGKRLGSRAIPSNPNLKATVLLTLPESDYNRNLGVFQIKVDFLSPCGEILYSSGHPCMLRYKSEPVRLLSTFLKAVPLLAGYKSESQTLKIIFRGLTNRDVLTSCIRVIIEQRAEFQPGAGIPEIDNSFLELESELPVLKRFLWNWKKTIYVWVSITSFTMEVLFTLVCCTPILIPSSRRRDGSSRDGVYQNSLL